MWGRERDSFDPPGWGPIIWQGVEYVIADLNDFHGCFIAETSEWSLSATRPTIWFTSENNTAFIFLDDDGAPMGRAGDVRLSATGYIYSGEIDFGMPRVLKQLRVIEGYVENLDAAHKFEFFPYLDGSGSSTQVGADITGSAPSGGTGYFERFWTQDSSDTCRRLILKVNWGASDNIYDQDGPMMRDVMLHAIALPDTTNVWTFLVRAEDDTMRTAKKIRTEMEGYKNDLLKYELPDGDSFNGVLTGIRMLRANEVRELVVDGNQPIPKYIMAATVREMVSS